MVLPQSKSAWRLVALLATSPSFASAFRPQDGRAPQSFAARSALSQSLELESRIGDAVPLNLFAPATWPSLSDVIDRAGRLNAHAMRNHSAAALVGVKQNSPEDLWAFESTVIFCATATAATFILFGLLLRWFPKVYAHRTEVGCEGFDESLPVVKGFFGWFHAASSVTDAQVIAVAGLDGLLLAEFHKLCRRFFSIIGSLAIIILCPLHLFASMHTDMDLLSRLSISLMMSKETSHFLLPVWVICWVHAAFVWIVVLTILKLVFDAQHRFLAFRFEWLMHVRRPRSTTLMVEGIPRQHCSDQALRSYFERLFTEQAVHRAYVVRRTHKLCRLVKKMEALELSLAATEAQWAAKGRDPIRRPRSGTLCGLRKGEDTMYTIEGQLREARAAVNEERMRVESMVPSCDDSVCSSSGFVTFSSRRWCRLASREQLQADASKFVMQMPPDPKDVRYEDLAKDPAYQMGSNWMSALLTFGVFCMWMPIVVTISGLANFDRLQHYVPFIGFICEQLPELQVALQGLLATWALKAFMSLLPSILMSIIRNFLTLKAETWSQLVLQNRYFAFQVTFVLLVTAIDQSFLRAFEDILENPKGTLKMLAISLPGASNFYMSYLVLGWLTLALGIIRIGPLFGYLLHPTQDSEQARRAAEPENQDTDGIGARLAKGALMMTIGMVFCTCSPLIGIFAWAYFHLGAVAYRYLVTFAEVRKPEMGGAFWVLSMQHIMVGLALHCLVMTTILTGLNGFSAVVAGSSILAVLVGYLRLDTLVWESLPFEAVADADYAAKSRARANSDAEVGELGEYVQPECFSNEAAAAGEEALAATQGSGVDQEAAAAAEQVSAATEWSSADQDSWSSDTGRRKLPAGARAVFGGGSP